MPTALITGANRGIGFEFTRQYAKDGWDIIASCRAPAKADTLATLARGRRNICIEALDVTDAKSIAALALKFKDTAIDLLINNAGIPSGHKSSGSDNYHNPGQEFGTLDAAGWLEVFRVNTIAPIMVAEALTPQVARSRDKKIVMISSRYGSIGLDLPGLIAYSTSKAALNMAMRKTALALKPQQVTVAGLHPGWVKTDMGGPNASLTPEQSVTGMRKVIDGLAFHQSGLFFGHNGESIPW